VDAVSDHATASGVEPAAARTNRALVLGAFSVLGAGLLWSRLVGLNQSLWHDEIYTVVHYVRPGPREIFGDYVPNDHMLFNVLTWATSSALGHSEVVYRLWSVLPFLAGVLLVARWLQRLEGLIAAGIYALLVTESPLLLDWSRQARGYGLAFFAMSLLTVAACQALETGARAQLLLVCAAGVIGTWDLPVFGLAFASVSLVLLSQKPLRTHLLPWLSVSVVAVGLWYAPVAGQIASSSHQEYGYRLPWHGLFTNPFAELLAPSLIPNGSIGHRGLVAAIVFGPLLVIGLRSFLRASRTMVAALVSGVLGTYVVLWLARLYVETRFLSYLLVPILVLIAVGASRLVRALPASRPLVRLAGTALIAGGVVWLGAVFVTSGLLATRYPFEAYKGAAAAVEKLPPNAVVVANLPHPDDLRYYLDRPIVTLPAGRLEHAVCRPTRTGLIYVEQPFRTPHIDLSCLRRVGATRERLVQYTRGDRIDVWFVAARNR
jgi:hypothetical protein